MKAKKPQEGRLVATVTFEVFEKADGSVFSHLTKSAELPGLAAMYLLENHLHRLRAGSATLLPVKEGKKS